MVGTQGRGLGCGRPHPTHLPPVHPFAVLLIFLLSAGEYCLVVVVVAVAVVVVVVGGDGMILGVVDVVG